METLLVAIAGVSVVIALVAIAIAWRLSRRERAHSAARVAALSLAASDSSATARTGPTAGYEAEAIAVGQSRAPAPRAATRVTTFASSTRPSPPANRSDPVDFLRANDGPDNPPSAAVWSDGFLGAGSVTPSSGRRQRRLAVAALALFAMSLAGGYWVVFGERSPAVHPVIAGASQPSPLELISLRHERRSGRLAVTGLVRNPVAGAPIDGLSAVVFLFDQQGGFITSARANIDFLKLSPGDESPFVINVDAPASVARYRVSFRNDTGLVPHVDRRGQEPIAMQVGAGS